MNRHSRGVLLAAGALAVVLAAGLWAVAASNFEQVLRLPDGSTLALEAVTYGNVHPFVHGSRWQKRLYPLVPPAVRNWSGWWARATGWMEGDYFSRQPNTLVLHVARRGVIGRPREPLRAVACDDRGVEFASGIEGGGGLFVSRPGEEVEAWELPVFPRRGRSVSVRVYEHVPGDRWNLLAAFVAPNPVPGPYPVWEPHPLPITKQAGDLAVSLTQLATGRMPGGPLGPSPPGENFWTRLALRMTRNGQPTTAWRPAAVTISDATGNVWQHRSQRMDIPRGETDLLFGGTLPASEKAYKLRVELSQAAGFSAGEQWTLHGVPVPKRDQRIDPAATTHQQGAELRLSLTGAVDPFGRGRVWRQPFPTVNVSVFPPSPDLQLNLLTARDDRGRALTVFGGHPASIDSGDYHFFLDRLPPDAARMDLRFAIHRNRFFEFLVAPPRS
jgi:hypothetical protein